MSAPNWSHEYQVSWGLLQSVLVHLLPGQTFTSIITLSMKKLLLTHFLVLLYRKKWVGYKFQFLKQIKTDLCLYQIYNGYTYSCDMCWVDVSRVRLTSPHRCTDRMVIWYVPLHTDLSCVGMVGHTNGTEKW